MRDTAGNEYVSLDAQCNIHLLKCIKFNGIEDLGDGIKCTRADQEIWVANYFVRHMIPVDKNKN